MKFSVSFAIWFLSVGKAAEAATDNADFQRSFEFNLDLNISIILSKYFPSMHKPIISENTVYIFAELYRILDVVRESFAIFKIFIQTFLKMSNLMIQNEVEETITTKVALGMYYFITNMPIRVWDGMLGPNVVYIQPPLHSVWIPDVVILNRCAHQ